MRCNLRKVAVAASFVCAQVASSPNANAIQQPLGLDDVDEPQEQPQGVDLAAEEGPRLREKASSWANLWNVRGKIGRLQKVIGMMKEKHIVHNFRNLDKLGFPTRTVSRKGAKVARFAEPSSEVKQTVKEVVEGLQFHWRDGQYGENQADWKFTEWLEERWTTGLVVLKIDSNTQARLLYEDYYRGNDAKSKAVSWSMCKSIISALMGTITLDSY